MKYAPWIISVVCLALLGVTWVDSRNKLEQKDAELETMRGQYNQLVVDANAKLEAANIKVKQIAEEANNKLKEQADDANAKIQQANQPEVQVRVGFRKALVSSGHVAGFTNTSSQSIAVTASIQRASSGQQRTFDLTLDPGRSKEIGEREGWAFVAGDTITVEQPGHKSVMFTAP